jgi:C4-type Zn-finger protein
MEVEGAKTCPKCGKQAILVPTGEVKTSYPAEHCRQWWCRCGYRETGPRRVERTHEQMAAALWAEHNQ